MKQKQFLSLATILVIVMSVVMVRADDHLFTLPVVGNDVEVEHAWYYEGGGLHQAIDYTRTTPGAILGQEILAAYGGIVDISENNHVDYGTYVKINHGNDYKTLYAHMINQSATVNNGDYVYQGQVIGQVGSTGNSTGPHLHFELIYNGVRVDPYGWYDYASTPNTYPHCNPDEYYWISNPPIGPPNVSTERQLPDDLLVHVIGTPHYYWLQDGLMRGFSCEYPFYTWGLEWDDAVEITDEEFNIFPVGANVSLMVGAGVFDSSSQRWVFDYASDTSFTIVKRKVNNWQQLGYAVDIWIPVSDDFLTQFNEGPEVLTINDYPYGAVLQNENNLSERYVLVQGDDYGMYGQKIKLALFSDDVYNLNYYHHNFNIPVSNSILSNYPTTSAQSLVMDGKLISGSGPEIYYLENGQKRHIVDAISFSYYGFSYANVYNVGDNLINVFPTGQNIFFSPSGGAGVYNGGELDDGGFDSGLEAYWLFSDWQEVADFEVTSENQVLGFYKSEAQVYSGVNYYDVEIKQLVGVESNELYHCSFYAKSNNPMMIKLNLGKDTSPWNNYGLWKEISTLSDWQKYQYIFNCGETDLLARLAFQIGEIPGHLYLDQVVFEQIGEILPPANNLLANADFELGHYAPWQLGDLNGLAGYYTDVFEFYEGQYSMFIDPNYEGEHFEVQLEQLVDVQAGETYYVSFYARAEEDRSIFLDLYHNGAPWTNYGLWEEVQVGTEWNEHNVQFTANNSGLVRFGLHFGHQDIGIWIDDIVFSEEPTGIITEIIHSAEVFLAQNYPNPFNPETKINYSVSESQAELIIYNVKGQVVKNYNLSPQESFVVWSGRDNRGKKVSSGVYLYVIKTRGQMTKMRKMILMK
jgi:hypothetical protein